MGHEQILSVSDLLEQANDLLAQEIGRVAVEAEVFEYRGPHRSSGHYYFKLRDDEASLDAKLWRGVAARALRCEIHEGQRVLVHGRLDIWAPRGSLALVLDRVEDLGVGDLARRFEELKNRLRQAGLFDEERKQPLPPHPRRVALITAIPSAAAADFMRTLEERRFPAELWLLPGKVQGEGAAEGLARTLRFAQQLDPDVVVITRGGGSLEDLWAFQEEVLVREVAACACPVLSAVGHETDVSLVDFAADESARTPTAAAVRLAQGWEQVRERVLRMDERLQSAMRGHLAAAHQRVDRAARDLRAHRPSHRLERMRRRLSEAEVSLTNEIERRLGALRRRLISTARGLHAHGPWQRTADLRLAVQHLEARLHRASPYATLQRGYAWLEDDADGRLIEGVEGVAVGQRVKIRLHDGTLRSEILEVHPEQQDGD